MSEEKKRLVAKKARVCDILSGEYIKKSGWDPSYITTSSGNISRINLIGFFVGKNIEDNIFIVDDGTGSISLRFFSKIGIDGINIGDLILVIGRPREWNNEVYVVPEIIKRIENPKWLIVRKIELEGQIIDVPKTKPANIKEKSAEIKIAENSESPDDSILNLIAALDKGDGADVGEIISKSKIQDAEEIITSLIEEGEIFQLRPGRVKVLE